MNNTGRVIIAALAGAATGLIAGILIAPASGEETRKNIEKEAKKFKKSLDEKLDEIKEAGIEKLEKLKKSTEEVVDKK